MLSVLPSTISLENGICQKIFLYTIFSFIISLVILFAKLWQHSRSLRYKAHAAYLALTITSVYSFFFDKVMNGKPDAYSIISCAAFSIMSLSLSCQTQCGFEVDLLYFFLGVLIVQLMKIKLQLFIVGAGFSYSLIILRSSFSSIDVGPNNELQDENLVVIEVHSPQSSMMVEQFDSCVKALQQQNSNLIEILLVQLKQYLSDFSDLNVSDPNLEIVLRPKENSNLVIHSLPLETIDNLHKSVRLMVEAGFEKDCSDVYNSYRREYLKEILSKLGLHKVSVDEVRKMTRQDFKDKVEGWIKASNVAFKILFPTERRLCDRVFFGFSSAADFSSTDVCRESTFQLLDFANAIAIGCRKPEQLFRVLDVFERMRDLIPEFESLQNEATAILKRLGEAIRGIFVELENRIRQDPKPEESSVPGGRLHPITRYVMNYLRVACESRQTLEQVFEEDRMHSSSSLSVQMGCIMELLERNLEAKSQIYKDPALVYVFMMNNVRYMVQKIEYSELETVLGDVVIKKHNAKIQQHHEHYQRSSWNKVLDILKLDNNDSMQHNEVAKSMKEKLKSFNMVFDDICRVQTSWFVYDEQLRKEIITSIEKILLPAYGNFIARFQTVPKLGKNADKYIKYGTEDIEVRLNVLFQRSGYQPVAKSKAKAVSFNVYGF